MLIGTVGPIDSAAIVGLEDSGGVENSGNGPLTGTGRGTVRPPSDMRPLCVRRASTEKSLVVFPVLVTVIVALTGWPCGRVMPASSGTPLALTLTPLKTIWAVNGIAVCGPELSLIKNTNSQRPGSGSRRKNCMVFVYAAGCPVLGLNAVTVLCTSMGRPLGSTSTPSRL